MTNPPLRDAEVPLQLSYYRLERELGRGGMGAVYAATDTRNDITVALKLLHPHLESDESFRDRFQREAHVAALLRSPYTVQLLDYGFEQGRYFLVMKFVEGQTVRDALRRAPLPPERALRVAAQVARALEEGEARGVVHRDIKPENIMLASDGTAQVLDFGIARQAGALTLTATGAFIGTLTYASPESFAGEADNRSDIYSLGATLYHLLAGQSPFAGDALELMRQHHETPPPRDPLASLPATVAEVVERCLAKAPEDRFQSASELAGVLEHLAQEAAERGDRAPELARTEALAPGGRPTAVTEMLALELGPPAVRRRLLPRMSRTSYALTLRNDADAPVDIELATTDVENTCTFSVPERVLVGAHETTTVSLEVTPRRRRWRGVRETRRFSVAASAGGGGPSLTVDGEFVDRPEGSLPYAGGTLFAVALLAVVVTLMAVLGGGAQELAPWLAYPVGGELSNQGTLEFDEPAFGALDATGEIHAWAFIASAGQVLSMGVTAFDPERLHPYLELIAPDGSLLAFEAGHEGRAWLDAVLLPAEEERTPPQAQTYTLRVRGFDDRETGEYQIQLVTEPDSNPRTALRLATGGGPTTLEETAFATLAPGAVDRWTFAGFAGLVLRGGAATYDFTPFDPFLELRGPDGSLLTFQPGNGGRAWFNGTVLPDDGQYTVLLRGLGDADTGRYALRLEALPGRVAPSPGTLGRGPRSAVGAIEGAGEVDTWSFDGQRDQVVSIRVEAYDRVSLHPYLELLAADGSLLAFRAGERGEAWVGGLVVPQDGRYTLRVRAMNEGATGVYDVDLYAERSPDFRTVTHPASEDGPVLRELRAGQTSFLTHFATLEPGRQDKWTFRGEAGRVINVGVETYRLDPFDPQLELLAPDGSRLRLTGESGRGMSAYLGPLRLPETGEYSLVVGGITDAAAGRYRLFLERP